MPGRWPIVVPGQRSADRGADTEHLEEVAGDERARDLATIQATADIGYLGKGVDENVRLTTERIELCSREARPLAVGGSWPFNRVYLVHVWNLIHVEKEHVQQRERHGDEAKSEGHGCNNGHRDQGSALECTKRVEDVSRHWNRDVIMAERAWSSS